MKEEQKGTQRLVEYLTQQNRQLKDEISDLKELVQMNKLEIDVLSRSSSSNKYIEVISNYRSAVDNYQKKIEILEQTIESSNSQKLMLEQLNQQANAQLKGLQELHRDRTQSLQNIIQDLERKVLSFQKNQRQYDSLTGFVQRTRDIYNPSEQAIEFMNKQAQKEEQIHLMKLEAKRGKQNEENLLKINGILRHKVITLQAKLAMPNKNLGQILDKSLKRLMMYFIETQKRILTGQQSDSQGQEDLQLIAPELSTYFGQEQSKRQKTYNVPHLDLLKIRGSIANGNQKIKEELLKRNHLSKQQRIERLQIQLEYTRRQLTRNIIELREETQRRRALERICEELESRNDQISQSYKQASDKLTKYLKKARQNKEKNMKTGDLDQTINDLSTTLVKFDNNLMDLQRIPQENVKALPSARKMYESPEQYKIHLELLARDLAKNTKIQHLEHLKKKQDEEQQEGRPRRMKRSTSNPFLYFNERRQQIMGVGQTIQKRAEMGRLEQTAIMGNIDLGLGRTEDLDDIDI